MTQILEPMHRSINSAKIFRRNKDSNFLYEFSRESYRKTDSGETSGEPDGSSCEGLLAMDAARALAVRQSFGECGRFLPFPNFFNFVFVQNPV